MADRDLNKWTLTDGTPKQGRLKGNGYPAFKEQIVKELKMLGVKHYYADVSVVDLASEVYKGYCDKRSAQDHALLMYQKVVERYKKFNCLVVDDGPIMV